MDTRPLVDFFLNAFSADELRRFLRYGPDGEAVVADLPGPNSTWSALAFSAAEVLEKRGLIDGAFFDRLVAERPRRRVEIEGVRTRLVSGPGPVVVPPPAPPAPTRPAAAELVLDLTRADRAERPEDFTWAPQEYIRRLADGQNRTATLKWTGSIRDDLVGVLRTPPDASARARIAESLQRFLRDVGWEVDEARIIAAEQAGTPLEVRCAFNAAELFALPWEMLAVGASGKPLGSHGSVTVRYAWPGITPPPRVATRARTLFAWSSGGGAVPAPDHQRALVGALAASKGEPSFDPAADVLAEATYGSLAGALARAQREGRPYTALHVLAHGRPIDASGSMGLALGDATVDGQTLRDLLFDHAPSLRLIVLCACRSSDPGPLDSHLGSVARELHRSGVEAVIASRLPLSVPGSTLLAGSLYGSLASGADLATALVEARRALRQSEYPADGLALQLWAAGTAGAVPFPR